MIHNFKSYLILISVGFMCGVAAFYGLSSTPFLCILILFALIFIISAIITISEFIRRRTSIKLCILLLIFSASFILGSLRIFISEYNYLKNLNKFPVGTSLFYGKVISKPEEINSFGQKSCYILISSYTDDENNLSSDGKSTAKVYFTESGFEKINLFDNVEFYGQLYAIDEKYILNERSNNTDLVIKAKTLIKSDFKSDNFSLSKLAPAISLRIFEAIDSIIYYNPERAAIAKGILAGDRSGFTEKMEAGFSDAGFMHIIAVSGMHVSILLSIISAVLLRFGLHRKIITVIAVPLLFIFCGIAGFTASSLRAAIMLTLSLLSLFADREYDMKTALFFSAIAILLISPYKLFTPSFILSFGATLGITLFYKPAYEILHKLFGKLFIPSAITGSIALSVSAFLGTAPFCASFFGNINFTAILTNIWIIPVVTVIFCLVLSGCILYFIFPQVTVSIISCFSEPFLKIVSDTADLFYDTGFGIIEFDYVPPAFYGFYAAFIIILYSLTKKI